LTVKGIQNMKKILAVVIACLLMCGMLVSCDNAEKMLEKADAALEEAPYTMTMKMDFETDNKDINKIFSAMNMEFPVTVDGKNVAMDMSMEMMGYTADINITVADMVMYYNIEMLGQSTKMKADLSQEQYEEFMEENNAEMMVDPEDFEELTVEKKDGKKYITCNGISDDGIKELNDMMADSLNAVKGKATVSDVSFVITLSDGKYESMAMTCVYSVTVAGETCNVTCSMSATFSYDNVAKITAPADANTYQQSKFDDLMG